MALNAMNKLIQKIERRLRTVTLPLPKDCTKDKWIEPIRDDTIPDFSRFFPHQVRIMIDAKKENKKNGYYLIDTDLLGGAEILGVKDIAWDVYGQCGLSQQSGVGMYDYLSAYNNYSMDDVMLLQARANMASVFNNSIFVEFEPPNKIKLQSATSDDITGGLEQIPLDVFVHHPINLSTIPPTQMKAFEDLATSDVANFILPWLEQFDDLETVYASVNFKYDAIVSWADKREDIIRLLDESHVNPANKNQPIMYCV